MAKAKTRLKKIPTMKVRGASTKNRQSRKESKIKMHFILTKETFFSYSNNHLQISLNSDINNLKGHKG